MLPTVGAFGQRVLAKNPLNFLIHLSGKAISYWPMTIANSGSPHPLSPGHRVGQRYEITREIGRGGMGAVYEASDLQLNRRVALKAIREDVSDVNLRRFHQEALAAGQLAHPHIVQVTDFVEGPPPYMVMEFLEGQSLGQRLRTNGPLVAPLACFVAVQVLSALGAAHERGIVHRDIKPGNIHLVATPAMSLIAKLMDDVGPPLTRANEIIGSAPYMAPEQIRGATVDQRTDIFAVGCVLYEMLANRRAFARPNAEQTMLAILEGGPLPPIDGVPNALFAIIAQATASDPFSRFVSAKQMQDALSPFAGRMTGLAEQAQFAQAEAPRSVGPVASSPLGASFGPQTHTGALQNHTSGMQLSPGPSGHSGYPHHRPAQTDAQAYAPQAPGPTKASKLPWILFGCTALAVPVALGAGALLMMSRNEGGVGTAPNGAAGPTSASVNSAGATKSSGAGQDGVGGQASGGQGAGKARAASNGGSPPAPLAFTDAGVRQDAGVPQAPGANEVRYGNCLCTNYISGEGSQSLGPTVTPPRCRCGAGPSGPYLCPEAPMPCADGSAGCSNHVKCASIADVSAFRPIAKRTGEVCSGYPLESNSAKTSGVWACRLDGGDVRSYSGVNGGPCRGYRTDGRLYEGKLDSCSTTPLPKAPPNK
jgi:serine/threonine protein kinase